MKANTGAAFALALSIDAPTSDSLTDQRTIEQLCLNLGYPCIAMWPAKSPGFIESVQTNPPLPGWLKCCRSADRHFQLQLSRKISQLLDAGSHDLNNKYIYFDNSLMHLHFTGARIRS